MSGMKYNLASALLAATFVFPSGAALAVEDAVLGASVRLTAPVANTGRYCKDAYECAVDKINEAGGIDVGGEKRKLALKIYDNQSDVNLSVRQYTQLVTQDKAAFPLGLFASDFALADSAVSKKYQILMVEGGGASDEIFSRGFKDVFGTLAPAGNYFGSAVKVFGDLDPTPKIRGAMRAKGPGHGIH